MVPSPLACSSGASPTLFGATIPSQELSCAAEPVLKDCEGQEVVSQLSVHIIAYRLRYIFGAIWLTTLQYGAIGPSVVYISTTFFAGGDADCSETPDSDLCKKGAADLAFWKGLSKGASHGIAWLLALTLGSWSDRHGRRPLFRAKAVMSILPIVALALHLGCDVSLWVYLVSAPVYDAFDINGVFLAFMSDVVKEHHSRATAFGVLIIGFIVGSGPVFPVAALLPANIAVVVSSVAAVMKLVYMFTVFPETSSYVTQSEAEERPKPGIVDVVKQAFQVFGRNDFIFRMVLVLVLSGISLAGLGAVVMPILTAYLGMKKAASATLAFVSGISVVASMAGLLPRLMQSIGPVRSLRLSLAVAAAYPALFALCPEGSHVTMLSALLVGPIFLQFPIISAIKSNVVGEDEQGLVQGALAAVRVVATAVADIFFGWFYRFATDGGQAPRSSTLVPLGAVTVLSIAALAIACSLPNKPPSPPLPPPVPGSLELPPRLVQPDSGKPEAASEGQEKTARGEEEVELQRV